MTTKLQPGEIANFQTLQRACQNQDLSLVVGRDLATGQRVPLICAVQVEANGDFTFVPLAKQFTGNPYEEVEIDGGGTDTGDREAARPGCDGDGRQSG